MRGLDGGGSGSASAGPSPGETVTIVDRSGTVIGSGHVTDAGVIETDITETTIVYRTLPPAQGWTAAGGVPSDIPVPADTTQTVNPSKGMTSRPLGGPIGVPFYVDPDSFGFHPVQDNWQETGCVPIVFAYGSPFLSPMQVRVGVRVGAPRRLANGRSISTREAQLNAANAATIAASEIIALLDEGALEPSGIQPRFTGFMGGALLAAGDGYRVNGCFPG